MAEPEGAVTPKPKSYAMFTPEGDEAVGHMIARLKAGFAEWVGKDVMPTRRAAYKTIAQEQAKVELAGHGEVTDTEVEEAICAELNDLWRKLYGSDIERAF